MGVWDRSVYRTRDKAYAECYVSSTRVFGVNEVLTDGR